MESFTGDGSHQIGKKRRLSNSGGETTRGGEERAAPAVHDALISSSPGGVLGSNQGGLRNIQWRLGQYGNGTYE